MRLNNWSIAASYDAARIFAGLGFGSSTASRIISRPRRTTARRCGALLGIDPAFQAKIVCCICPRRQVALFGHSEMSGSSPQSGAKAGIDQVAVTNRDDDREPPVRAR
jgi:hypothetical protein